MKEEVVRAGKYISIGTILIAFSPVLVPLLLALSFVGFAVVLPLGCTYAGFHYLRKYAGMLYRKLAIAGSWGPSRGSIAPAPRRPIATFTELPSKDSKAIYTYEDLDQEFDAVLVSTAPQEVDTDDEEDGSASESLPVSGTSAEAESRREGNDDPEVLPDEEGGTGPDTVESFDEEGPADASSGLSYASVVEKDEEQEEGRPKQLSYASVVEKDEEQEEGGPTQLSYASVVEKDEEQEEGRPTQLSYASVVEKDEEQEEGRPTQLSEEEEAESRPPDGGLVQDDFAGSVDGGNTYGSDFEKGEETEDRPAAADLGIAADDGASSAGIDEERGKGLDVAIGERGEDGEGLESSKEGDETEIVEKGNFEEDALVDTAADDVAYGEGRESAKEEEDETELVDEGNVEKDALVGTAADDVEDGEGRESTKEKEDETDIVDKGSVEKDPLVETAADDVGDGEGQEHAKEREDEIEVVDKGDIEKDALFDTAADDIVDTPPIVDERSFETLEGGEKTPLANETDEETKKDKLEALADDGVHGEVKEEQEGADPTPTRGGAEVGEESKEEKVEPVSDEVALRKADEDREKEYEPPVAAVSSPGSSPQAPVEDVASPKPDTHEGERSSGLLPHQANEDDIWTCRDCGWKYPNAKPSAKIRRNHKKHCKGHGPPSPASGGGSRELDRLDSLSSEGSGKMETGWRPTTVDDSSPKKVGEDSRGEDEPVSSAKSDTKGVKFTGASIANEPITEESTKEIEAEAIPQEQGSSSPHELQSKAIQDKPRSNIEHPLSFSTEKNNQGLLSGTPQPQENESVRDNEPAHLSSEATSFTPSGLVSARSGMGSRSFHSIPDDFNASESFRSAADEFQDSGRWSSWHSQHSQDSNLDDEQDQLAQVQEELQLRDDLNAVKGIVGNQRTATGPLLADIEELSEFLGIALPAKSTDLPEIEWAKVSIEVMKIVVGIE